MKLNISHVECTNTYTFTAVKPVCSCVPLTSVANRTTTSATKTKNAPRATASSFESFNNIFLILPARDYAYNYTTAPTVARDTKRWDTWQSKSQRIDSRECHPFAKDAKGWGPSSGSPSPFLSATPH